MFQISRYLFCLLLFVTSVARAQQYPVTASTQIIPPYSVYLPDYAVPGSDKLRVILVQNDLTQPSYDVILQMTVEQNGTLIMRTSGAFHPKPLTLMPGVPTIISGTDLSDYLSTNNIDFSGGFSRETYDRNKSLPEGAYRISFTAYDYRRQQVQVSNVGANIFFFQKSDPPLLNLPICGSRVEKRDPQFLSFNWSSRNTPNPLPGSGTEYVFSLYEIKPKNSNADYIVRSSTPVYTITTESNTIIYGPGEPQLIDSMQYAWNVQARDKSGRDLFSNQGLSQTCTFTYLGTNPFAVNNIKQPLLYGASNGERSIKLHWPLADNNSSYTVEAYRLQYRAAAKDGTEFDWSSEELSDSVFTLNSLEPNRTYESRLQWRIAGVYGPYSEVVKVTTDSLRTFVCGDGDLLKTPENTKPLLLAIPGFIVRIGHFDVLLTQVSGSNGVFTGKGRVITPGFGIGLLMTFSNITINTDLVVIKGEMQAVTSGIDKFVSDAVKSQRGGNDVGQVKTGDIVTDITTKLHIFSTDNIKVDTTSHTITITSPQGGGTEVIDYAKAGKTLPLVLEDADGNLYSVDKNGTVTSAGTRDKTMDAATLASLNNLQLSNGKVTFVASGKYAFDAWKDAYAGKSVLDSSYELLANGQYRVSAKAILPGVQDTVTATLENGKDIDVTKIKFANGKGIVYPSKNYGNNFTVTITGGPASDAQEMYALYPKAGGGYISMGKLLIASYAPKQKTLVLIPIGKETAVPVAAIQSSMEKAYANIGVTYTIIKDDSFRESTDWDTDGNGFLQDTKSAFLSNGFTGEEKEMKKAYAKSHDIKDDAVYLFIVNEATLANGDLLGKMPRQSQYGFIFEKGKSDADVALTVAHETGHGQFTLEHTFSSGIGLTQGTTDNLMDYNNGSALLKYQWDVVHDPGHVWGIFDGDDASADLSTNNIPKKLLNGTTFNFMTPTGKKLTLPQQCAVTFNFGVTNISEIEYPIGYVYNFSIKNENNQVVTYTASISDGMFKGYVDAKGALYQDKLTGTDKNENVILFVPESDGIRYMKLKSKEGAYVNNEAIKTYADFPVTPYLNKDDFIDQSDIIKYSSISSLTKNRNEDWTLYQPYFKSSLQYHNGQAIHSYIVKIVELRTAYRDLFGQFSDCYDTWDATLKKFMTGSTATTDCIGWWETSLRNDHPERIPLIKSNPVELYKFFLHDFVDYIRMMSVVKDDFLKNLSLENTTQLEATNALMLFSNDEISKIPWAKREILFQVLARKGLYMNAELVAVRLAKYMPDGDHQKLLDAFVTDQDADNQGLLIKRYLGQNTADLNGEQFYQFVNILHSYASEKYTFDNSAPEIGKNQRLNRYFSFDPAFWTGKPIVIDMLSTGKVNMAFRHQFTTITYGAVSVDPYESVTLHFDDNKSTGEFILDKGKTYTTSGIMAYALCYSVAKDNLKIGAMVVLNTALMATGIGELNTALALGRTGGIILGGTDIALGVGAILVDTKYRDVWQRTENGKLVLKFWDYGNLLYAGTMITRVMVADAMAARDAAKAMEATADDAERAALVETENQADNIINTGEGKAIKFVEQAAADAAGMLAKYPDLKFVYGGMQKGLGSSATNFESALKSCSDDVMAKFSQNPEMLYKLGNIEGATEATIKSRLDDIANAGKDFGTLRIAAGNVPGQGNVVLFSKLKNNNGFSGIKSNFDGLNDAQKSVFLNNFKGSADADVIALGRNNGELFDVWKANQGVRNIDLLQSIKDNPALYAKLTGGNTLADLQPYFSDLDEALKSKFLNNFKNSPDADLLALAADNGNLFNVWKVNQAVKNIDLLKSIRSIFDAIRDHLKIRVPSVDRDIKGCHDATMWDNNSIVRKESLVTNPGYTVPSGLPLTDLSVPQVVVISDVAHTTPGVRIVEYKVPIVSNSGATAGQTTGALKSTVYKKTIYDPNIWPDARLEQACNDALQDAYRTGSLITNPAPSTSVKFKGTTRDGYIVEGFFDVNTKAVTTFYFY
ncbi:hypothetical protein SAMN05428988_4751 [Chitinophaga sp. YR573]|nr:hypothetical protein SAMN05428988_4751 [Chitinophaga sp. YR573]